MTDQEIPPPPGDGDPSANSVNIPDAIIGLLADMADLKTRLAAAEAEIATLKGA